MRSRSIYGREYSMKGFHMGENKCLSKSNFCMKRITLDRIPSRRFADRSSNYYYYFLVIRSKSKPNRSSDLFIHSNGLVNRSNGLLNHSNDLFIRSNGLVNRSNGLSSLLNGLPICLIIHSNGQSSRSNNYSLRLNGEPNRSITVHHPCVFAVRTVFR